MRNLAFAPVLFGFFVAEALYQLGRLDLMAGGQARGVALALDMTLTMLPAAVILLLAASGLRIVSPLAPQVLVPAALLAWSVAFGQAAWALLSLLRTKARAARAG